MKKPTKRQIQSAIKLIEKDCLARFHYVDEDGDTCALGCLALAAGVKRTTLRTYSRKIISFLPNVARKIESKFGLNAAHQDRIQYENDSTAYVHKRRSAIVAYLKGLLK